MAATVSLTPRLHLSSRLLKSRPIPTPYLRGERTLSHLTHESRPTENSQAKLLPRIALLFVFFAIVTGVTAWTGTYPIGH